MRRLAGAHELDTGRRHICSGKNQILNLASIYLQEKGSTETCTVNESIIKTYDFTSACLPLLRGPRISRLFRFKNILNNRLPYGRTST